MSEHHATKPRLSDEDVRKGYHEWSIGPGRTLRLPLEVWLEWQCMSDAERKRAFNRIIGSKL